MCSGIVLVRPYALWPATERGTRRTAMARILTLPRDGSMSHLLPFSASGATGEFDSAIYSARRAQHVQGARDLAAYRRTLPFHPDGGS